MTINIPVGTLLNRFASNPHTSISAIVWGACKLGSIWFPQYKDKFDATEAIAVSYGLLMAGDAGKSAKDHEETKQLVGDLQNQIQQVKQDTASVNKPNV